MDHTSVDSREEQTEYEVEKILAGKIVADKDLYVLVKWKGYPYKSCTWEPEQSCERSEKLLSEWRKLLAEGNTLSKHAVRQIEQRMGLVPEQILHQKSWNGKLKYLVKWDGYSVEESTWEPEEHLGGSPLLNDWRSQWARGYRPSPVQLKEITRKKQAFKTWNSDLSQTLKQIERTILEPSSSSTQLNCHIENISLFQSERGHSSTHSSRQKQFREDRNATFTNKNEPKQPQNLQRKRKTRKRSDQNRPGQNRMPLRFRSRHHSLTPKRPTNDYTITRNPPTSKTGGFAQKDFGDQGTKHRNVSTNFGRSATTSDVLQPQSADLIRGCSPLNTRQSIDDNMGSNEADGGSMERIQNCSRGENRYITRRQSFPLHQDSDEEREFHPTLQTVSSKKLPDRRRTMLALDAIPVNHFQNTSRKRRTIFDTDIQNEADCARELRRCSSSIENMDFNLSSCESGSVTPATDRSAENVSSKWHYDFPMKNPIEPPAEQDIHFIDTAAQQYSRRNSSETLLQHRTQGEHLMANFLLSRYQSGPVKITNIMSSKVLQEALLDIGLGDNEILPIKFNETITRKGFEQSLHYREFDSVTFGHVEPLLDSTRPLHLLVKHLEANHVAAIWIQPQGNLMLILFSTNVLGWNDFEQCSFDGFECPALHLAVCTKSSSRGEFHPNVLTKDVGGSSTEGEPEPLPSPQIPTVSFASRLTEINPGNTEASADNQRSTTMEVITDNACLHSSQSSMRSSNSYFIETSGPSTTRQTFLSWCNLSVANLILQQNDLDSMHQRDVFILLAYSEVENTKVEAIKSRLIDKGLDPSRLLNSSDPNSWVAFLNQLKHGICVAIFDQLYPSISLPRISSTLYESENLVCWQADFNTDFVHQLRFKCLFPSGIAMTASEASFIGEPDKMLEILAWIKEYIQKPRAKMTLMLPPNVIPLLHEQANVAKDGQTRKTLQDLAAIIAELITTEALSSILDAHGNYVDFDPRKLTVESPGWESVYGCALTQDQLSVAEQKRNDEQKAQRLFTHFASWALRNMSRYRRFVALSSDRRKPGGLEPVLVMFPESFLQDTSSTLSNL